MKASTRTVVLDVHLSAHAPEVTSGRRAGEYRKRATTMRRPTKGTGGRKEKAGRQLCTDIGQDGWFHLKRVSGEKWEQEMGLGEERRPGGAGVGEERGQEMTGRREVKTDDRHRRHSCPWRHQVKCHEITVEPRGHGPGQPVGPVRRRLAAVKSPRMGTSQESSTTASFAVV